MVWGNSLWQLVRQSDGISKGVLLTLLFMSIACWTIFLYKILVLRKKNREMRAVQQRLAYAASIEEVMAIVKEYADTVPGLFLASTLNFLRTLQNADMPGERKWHLLQEHLEESIDVIVEHESSYIPVLSTSAVVSPLLGLFGTVWGLIHAFVRISEKQSADIATIAPGIAEALITTLGGLIVAVPALVMAHVVATRVRNLEYRLITLSHRVNMLVRILFL
jgi:biopolymer transport protein ExbB/TolQ